MVIIESMISHRVFADQLHGDDPGRFDRLTLGLGKAAAVVLFAYLGLKVSRSGARLQMELFGDTLRILVFVRSFGICWYPGIGDDLRGSEQQARYGARRRHCGSGWCPSQSGGHNYCGFQLALTMGI